MPTFTPPRRVEIILHDDNGHKRVAVAERARGYASQPHWNLALTHDPSGRSWPASFNGNAIIDALGALIEQKDGEFHTQRGRAPQLMQSDRNVRVYDNDQLAIQNLTDTKGRPVAFGRAAAEAARAGAAEAMAKRRR